jgi:transcriptional regulator with XRE-family HTH domain
MDMTQEEVAAEIGKTEGAISQYETGRITPERAVADKLDRLLRANGKILAGFGYAMPTLPPDAAAALQAQVLKLIAEVDQLTATVHAQGVELKRLGGQQDQRES